MARAVDQPRTAAASTDIDTATLRLAQCNLDNASIVKAKDASDRPAALRHTSSTSSTATIRGSESGSEARAAGSVSKLDTVDEVGKLIEPKTSFSSAFQSRRKPKQTSAAPTRPPSSWHRMPSFGSPYERDFQCSQDFHGSPTSSASTASSGGTGSSASNSYATTFKEDGPVLYSPTMIQTRSAASDTPPAVPTLRNLRGKWKLLKLQSDDVGPVLAIQGYSAPIRKAVGLAPVFLDISYQSAGTRMLVPEPDVLRIKQHTTGGMMAITEEWHLDWVEREQKDGFLGRMRVRSRWRRVSDFNYMAQEEATQPRRSMDSLDDAGVSFFVAGLDPEEEVVEAIVESLDRGWRARHVWHIDAEDHFVRRVFTRKGTEYSKVTMRHGRRDIHRDKDRDQG